MQIITHYDAWPLVSTSHITRVCCIFEIHTTKLFTITKMTFKGHPTSLAMAQFNKPDITLYSWSLVMHASLLCRFWYIPTSNNVVPLEIWIKGHRKYHHSIDNNNTNNNNPIYKALEALVAGQSWLLIKSLTEEVRLKPRFKYRQWVNSALIIVSGNEFQPFLAQNNEKLVSWSLSWWTACPV